ncbi:MAG: AAA family ATPase, partial [Acidobacteria bacterium]|nr:AAA family ATPase [Acidobacteriota bacterium]
MILGLTGRNASGKGEVAHYLRSRSFYFHSLSDVIREEIRSRGDEVSRDNLIAAGNELRSTHGAAVLAERILQKLQPDKNYVVDSFRNPAEVQVFRRRPD